MGNKSDQTENMRGWILKRVGIAPSKHGVCWLWKLKPNANGYGSFIRISDYKRVMAHRVLYEEYRGKIKEGLVLDHLCRNPLCVNPWHLEAVPQKVNLERANENCPTVINRNKTNCKHGHEFTKENTYISKEGKRSCMECNRNKQNILRNKRSEGWVKPFRVKITVKLNKRINFIVCKDGHEISGDNVSICNKTKQIRCKICVNKSNSERYKKTRGDKYKIGYIKKSHCKNGHEYTEENTYTKSNGHIQCRECMKQAVKRYSERKKSENANSL